VLSLALLAYGFAFRDTDPSRTLNAFRRGIVIAHDSGNRFNETNLADGLAVVEAARGDTLAALDYVAVGIRSWNDAGNTTMIRRPLAVVAAVLDRLGHYQQAAVIAGFAVDALTAQLIPEITITIALLRKVLGDETYDELAARAEAMTMASMAAYAYDQIDQARKEVEQPR
jgi:hypothetical protein